MKSLHFVLLLWVLAYSCTSPVEQETVVLNDPAPGFNVAGSDARAIEIADEVMEAIGGRQAWDDTKILTWSFFGNRHLIWDKETGDVRIDSPGDSTVYLYNIFDRTGQVQLAGRALTKADSLDKYLERAHGMWINDAYWFVLPSKLKDSGVTLKYLREEAMQSGEAADVLQLTFEAVGNTPDNKYEVWVDKSDHLLKQWAYYAKYDQAEPNYIRPWDNYKRYGAVMLSSDRSDNSGPRHATVLDSISSDVFTEWAQPELVVF